jgi:hypothetical protein
VTNARFAALHGLPVVPYAFSTTPVPLRKSARSSRAAMDWPQVRRASVCGSAAALRSGSVPAVSPPALHSFRSPTADRSQNSYDENYFRNQFTAGIDCGFLLQSPDMKSRLLANGLSRRTNRCLTTAGVPIDKAFIIRALKTGKIYPNTWPPNYGKLTHFELCKWAGVDGKNTPYIPRSEREGNPYLDNGLSYRANRCLLRSAIPITKKAVRHALQTGILSPGKRPSNYGKQTHAELCRWASVDPKVSPVSR